MAADSVASRSMVSRYGLDFSQLAAGGAAIRTRNHLRSFSGGTDGLSK
jgi:hypothetical protein